MRSLAMLRNRTPVPYAPSRSASFMSLPVFGGSGRGAQLEAYGSVGTLYAIVHRTSNATSQVGWDLYRTQIDGRRVTATGEPPQRTPLARHAALDLWNMPNPFQTGQEFREATQQFVDLVGESVWAVVRDPRVTFPTELWNVNPNRITPVTSPTEFLTGWIYTGPSGEKVPLGLDDVIQIKMPNPLDPYRGLGPVQAILTDLDSARYSAAWNRNFFLNSAEPGGVIEVDKRLTDEEFEEMSARWREQHQGVSQAHRVAIVEQGSWKSNAMSQKDMQFAELRNVSREIIREAFGIHGHMIGNSENVNKANAESGEISFARWLVTPRVERIKQAINAKLLPMFGSAGQGVEFDNGQVVPSDREADDRERLSKAQSWQLLVSGGANPDDAAAAVGLPPMRTVPQPTAPATAPLNGHALPVGAPV